MLRGKIAKIELVDEWANVEKLFRCGSQGIAGVLKTRTSPSLHFVFKLSQTIDYLVEHEYKIMNRLNDLEEFCPHFCHVDDYVMCLVEPRLKKYKNPFDLMSPKPIYKTTLFEEYIHGSKLGSHIDNKSSLASIFSAIKQTIIAVAIAQAKTRFTHYDLHSDNVIMTKCDSNKVFLYTLQGEKGEEVSFAIPSNGHQAKIIDFGFSYIDVSERSNLTTSLFHTDVGYTSTIFDWVTDAKIFLISTVYHLEAAFGNSKKVKQFKNCVRNMFRNLNVEWECGWDEYDGDSLSDQLLVEAEEDYRDTSFLFTKHKQQTLEILQSIITLPFQANSTADLSLSYCVFVKEFAKIEEQVENNVHLFYILKTIVDYAKSIKSEYERSGRASAVSKFKDCVTSVVDSVASFCTIKGLNYERMLCSLYSFGECASGFFYKTMKRRYKIKTRDYDALPIQNIHDIVNVLYYNCRDEYEYNKHTTIVVYDTIKQSNFEFKLAPIELELLAKTEYWMKAPILNEIYKQNLKLQSKLEDDPLGLDESTCELSENDLLS